MTDYNDGLWHGWNGGECPVDPATEVQIVWLNNDGVATSKSERTAGNVAFTGNQYGSLIAFRVMKRAPREMWAFRIPTPTGDDWATCNAGAHGAVKFREVIE